MSETLFYGKPISEANIFKLIEAYSSMRNNPHEAAWYVNTVIAIEAEIIRRQSRIAQLEAQRDRLLSIVRNCLVLLDAEGCQYEWGVVKKAVDDVMGKNEEAK